MKKLSFFSRFGKWIAIGIVLLLLFFLIIVTLLFQREGQRQSNLGSYGAGEVPEAVLQWQPYIEQELAKYGRTDDIHVLLAITTQESGGTASFDIMQASESLGLPPNTIQDPLFSIEVGVRYFDEVMTQAENARVDVDTAIQAYNMGNGYINFVAQNGGKHSVDLAQQFSNKMKAQLGWGVYGDPNYVAHVKRYLGESVGNLGKDTAFGQLQNPYLGQEDKYVVTSELGWRWGKLHAGIDLAPLGAANLPIGSAGEGTVEYTGYSQTGGFMVRIRHDEYVSANGNTLYTQYLHLAQPPSVNIGDLVDKGQIIGLTGTTGSSTTGVHLHFEVLDGKDNPVNPRNFVDFSPH
ncbi:lysozyme family protein [Desemzia sp. C1]|uniref:lysozyme family protein n=1 Tax=Desemzia sp. C1 TaxID=2892016 RepID=UPI001E528E3D|nr:lysozyme family protein [Desemzia sp. C1]MCI3027547.1 lysozyme family protein [Desemzia sp. C1]